MLYRICLSSRFQILNALVGNAPILGLPSVSDIYREEWINVSHI